MGHLHAGKSRQQLWGFRDQVDARIFPPVDEYYIMQCESGGEFKNKANVVGIQKCIVKWFKVQVRSTFHLDAFYRMRMLAIMPPHELQA